MVSKVGRQQKEWIGKYAIVDEQVADQKDLEELKFQIIKEASESNNGALCIIPLTWILDDNQNFLYPPSNYKVANQGPANWSSKTFTRHYYPQSSWLEYTVGNMELKKPSMKLNFIQCYFFKLFYNKFIEKMLAVRKAIKELLKGKSGDDVTDSDVPLPHLRKRKIETYEDFLNQGLVSKILFI